MKNWNEWLKAAGLRALRTVAQTAVATIGTTAAIHEVDWLMVGSTALLAGVLSVLTSLAGLPQVQEKQEAKEEKMVLDEPDEPME